MKILKALSKQLFGAGYESIVKSLAACMILFLAVHTAEISMEISPSVLFMTATVFPAGIMWQSLHSPGNADRVAGLFMLPFGNREMTFSVVLAFTGYTLITKTFPVLALFYAVHGWSPLQIAVSLLCACNGCTAAAAWYVMISGHNEALRSRGVMSHENKKQLLCVAFWCVGILLAIFLVWDITALILSVSVSLFLSFLKFWMTDAYVFYCQASSKQLIRRTKGTGSMLLYLLRYLITNKNYLLNTVALCVLGSALPVILGQSGSVNMMPLGFAILCMNTPICILLSCDPDLEQAVRILPGQAGCFCIRYGSFIFFVNMAVSSVYLVSWQIWHGGVGRVEILAAVLIALQSAVLSVCQEWFFPVRNWKTESDLWHHPRKYIIPLIMLPVAGLVGIWPAGIWLLLCIVSAELLSLLLLRSR